MILTPVALGRLCRARDLLLEQRESPLRLTEIAREVDISPFHLIRLFEAVFGLTPHQFRIASRLELARHLLAAGQHSVTEVCMEVGFSSVGSFSSLFARRLGETPSSYQRRVRSSVQVPNRGLVELMPGCLSLMSMLPASAFVRQVRNFREA